MYHSHCTEKNGGQLTASCPRIICGRCVSASHPRLQSSNETRSNGQACSIAAFSVAATRALGPEASTSGALVGEPHMAWEAPPEPEISAAPCAKRARARRRAGAFSAGGSRIAKESGDHSLHVRPPLAPHHPFARQGHQLGRSFCLHPPMPA
eukprot:3855494-Prymnesium_polylepis.1